MMLGVGNDAQWRRFCSVAGLEHLVDDPRFVTNAARVTQRDETVRLVSEAMRAKTTSEWLSLLQASGVPCSSINTLDQALAHPQVQARQLIVQTEHPVLGPMQNVGIPVKFNDEPREATSPAPILGQHTEEVLGDMGLSADDIQSLAAQGVVGLA